jgi:hypothetical protein
MPLSSFLIKHVASSSDYCSHYPNVTGLQYTYDVYIGDNVEFCFTLPSNFYYVEFVDKPSNSTYDFDQASFDPTDSHDYSFHFKWPHAWPVGSYLLNIHLTCDAPTATSSCQDFIKSIPITVRSFPSPYDPPEPPAFVVPKHPSNGGETCDNQHPEYLNSKDFETTLNTPISFCVYSNERNELRNTVIPIAVNLPKDATFNAQPKFQSIGHFRWTPTAEGIYTVTFVTRCVNVICFSESTPVTATITIHGSNPDSKQCVVAHAAYGTEIASRVQQLREFRDMKVLSTETGKGFMNGILSIYYVFSPYVASAEDHNIIVKEAVMIILYPLVGILQLSSLSQNNVVSEYSVLGFGFISASMIGAVYGWPIGTVLRKVKNKNPDVKLALVIILGLTSVMICSLVLANNTVLIISSSLLLLHVGVFSAVFASYGVIKLAKKLTDHFEK